MTVSGLGATRRAHGERRPPSHRSGSLRLDARLRTIAAHVEELPLDAAAEVLVLLEPAVATFERHAALEL